MSDNDKMLERNPDQAHRLPRDSEDGSDFRASHASDQFSGSSGVLFEQAMAQTRMAICLTDPKLPDNPIVFANRAFRDLTGYRTEEIIGRNCRFLQGPDTDQDQVQMIRDAIERQDVVVVELLNYRRDGTPFWNALHLGPIFDDDGEVRYLFGSQWDVTDVHAARSDEAHAKLMARELSHRMKNMFTVISSIIRMYGRMEGQEDAAERINRRIMALGRAHESTLQPDRLTARSSVADLVNTVLEPYADDLDQDEKRIHTGGDEIAVSSNLISLMGLMMHELATNAMKYGALGDENGRLDFRWWAEEDEGRPILCLRWTESGLSTAPEPPEEGGMGTQLVERLLTLAGGSWETDWRNDGLTISIRVPMD